MSAAAAPPAEPWPGRTGHDALAVQLFIDHNGQDPDHSEQQTGGHHQCVTEPQGGPRRVHPACPRLASTRWRVDVAISTSSLQKCLKPSVLMQLGLSDGKLKNFELPLEKFNELRFNVAKALRAVQDLEAHPLIRVINHVDAFERAELAKESAKK